MPPKKEEVTPCGSCHKSIGGKEGIQCEICEKWTHSKCANISSEVYEVISNNGQLHWFCQACNSGIGNGLKEVTRLQEKMSTMESSMDKQSRDMREVQKDLNSIKNNLQKDINTCKSEIDGMRHNLLGMDKSINSQREQLEAVRQGEIGWAEVVTKHVDNELKTRSQEVQIMQSTLSQVRESALEEQDKENRRNNIVLHRVPENDKTTFEERNKSDTQFCLQVFSAIKSGVAEEDIIKVFRLGAKKDDNERPRPILVQLGSRLAKNLIMENLNRLKHADGQYKKVIISHDMTQKEREECKALVMEAKEKTANESGEWIHVVRGRPSQMRILRVRKTY